MAKGNIAKEYVVNKIKSAFGEDFIGEQDKKFYVWGIENGEKVQVALSLTCPKNPIGGMNFDMMEVSAPVVEQRNMGSAEITAAEQNKIDELMKILEI
jgi:hypothetical protein